MLVLACQVIFMIIVVYFIVFRILGSNYDAAVMSAGLCGHGLGVTPSTIVNMTAINEKYGMSRKAMMIVPIVGAFLVDIIYQLKQLDNIHWGCVNTSPMEFFLQKFDVGKITRYN